MSGPPLLPSPPSASSLLSGPPLLPDADAVVGQIIEDGKRVCATVDDAFNWFSDFVEAASEKWEKALQTRYCGEWMMA